ncbi:hypothetical protein Vadar_006575 [Vaccinium darrowii]|uniref:Uncharacterized protein n=1 Tax=Vaccinium darrowii TaxID=229202 RepID=A0ACB7YTY7_9ERIC|nr:hypothetical protein Vadar_006575 [Vaccinium darrowii]
MDNLLRNQHQQQDYVDRPLYVAGYMSLLRPWLLQFFISESVDLPQNALEECPGISLLYLYVEDEFFKLYLHGESWERLKIYCYRESLMLPQMEILWMWPFQVENPGHAFLASVNVSMGVWRIGPREWVAKIRYQRRSLPMPFFVNDQGRRNVELSSGLTHHQLERLADAVETFIVLDIAMAFDKHNVEKDVAEAIKKEFDRKHGPTWHCIIGKKFRPSESGVKPGTKEGVDGGDDDVDMVRNLVLSNGGENNQVLSLSSDDALRVDDGDQGSDFLAIQKDLTDKTSVGVISGNKDDSFIKDVAGTNFPTFTGKDVVSACDETPSCIGIQDVEVDPFPPLFASDDSSLVAKEAATCYGSNNSQSTDLVSSDPLVNFVEYKRGIRLTENCGRSDHRNCGSKD